MTQLEMPTFDEISAELSKPDVVEQVIGNEKLFPVISQAISKKGFQLLDENGKKTLLENYRNSELKNLVGEETKNIHSNYDKDLREVFGENADILKPMEGETKTYHVNKRILKTLLAEKKALEEKVAKGDHKEFYEGKIKEVEARAAKALEDKGKELLTLQQQIEGAQKESRFTEAYTPVLGKIDPEVVKDDLFQMTFSAVKEHVLKNSKLENGQFVMLDKDGQIVMDDMFKPVTVSSYLEDKFKSKFKKEASGGVGTGGTGGTVPANPDKITIETFNPGEVKTKGELMKSIVSAGVAQGSSKYYELYGHFSKKLKLAS